MPNIELHGSKAYPQNDDLRVVLGRIREYLKGSSYFADVVVTFVEDSVLNMKGEHQPFLRVWATDEGERNDIVRQLEPLDMGIELPPLLDRYIPSKSEQETARKQEQKQAPKPDHRDWSPAMDL